jgi:hypothetical protein
MPDPTATRFPALEMRDANAQCGVKPNGLMKDRCPRCDNTVMLHCGTCKIQVTGCLCTEVDRFGNSEAMQRLIERLGPELAEEKLKAAGFWIPPEKRNN